MNSMNIRPKDKEITWLSFNERVLQEAADKNNLLGDRLKFLGIFSSNQDEFFRVRVASLKRLCQMNKSERQYLIDDPEELLKEINRIVNIQRERYDQINDELLEELHLQNVLLVDGEGLDERQREFVTNYFDIHVRSVIFPIMIDIKYSLPYLKDDALYLVVQLKKKGVRGQRPKYSIIEIPKKILPRFVKLPSADLKTRIIYIDDIVRAGLHNIFEAQKFDEFNAYNIKLTRDSELEIDSDNIYHSYVDNVNESLKRRKEGDPIRFIYDREMPQQLVTILIKKLKLHRLDSIIPSGRYHNMKDLITLPDVAGLKQQKKLKAVEIDSIKKHKDLFHVMKKKDIMLYFPYHSFNTIIDWLREASTDPRVESIKISLYRVASFSSITNALINAKKNRKDVTVHFELQARFDEENNIYWAKKLQEEGVRVFFGIEGLKVHSKMCLITRREKNGLVRYCSIGTGNLNENTARLYTDCCLLSVDETLTREVEYVFNFLEKGYSLDHTGLKEILVSPFNMRTGLYSLIDNEIANAKKGKEAWICIKVNNLSDKGIEKKLYEADQTGVKIRIICRGRFTLITGQPGFSENIEGISIVDRFLEHSRFYLFANGGDMSAYIGSSDLQTRNIDRRVEVITPIKRKKLRTMLKDIFELQWRDNKKARVLDPELKNHYRAVNEGEAIVSSQVEVYNYINRFKD